MPVAWPPLTASDSRRSDDNAADKADPLIPYPNGQYLDEHIDGARLITFPRVSHIPTIESPDKFNREVMDFLARPATGCGIWGKTKTRRLPAAAAWFS